MRTEKSVKRLNIVGKVKSIRKITSLEMGIDDIVSENMIAKNFIEEECYLLFNSEGCLVEKSSKKIHTLSSDHNLPINNKLIFSYDHRGLLIEKKEYVYDLINRSCILIYDTYGKIIEERNYGMDGGLSRKFLYKHNNQNSNIRKDEYWLDNELFITNIYKYDRKGNQIEINTYDPESEYLGKEVFKYDESHNRIEEWFYHTDGRLEKKTTYKYDERGNETEKADYITNNIIGNKWNFEYKYDETGNWIRNVTSVRLNSKIRCQELNRSYKVIKDRIIEYR